MNACQPDKWNRGARTVGTIITRTTVVGFAIRVNLRKCPNSGIICIVDLGVRNNIIYASTIFYDGVFLPKQQ